MKGVAWMNDDERMEQARKRARELREFYAHVTVYVVVNLVLTVGLFTINWLASPDNWWFFWPLIGTGVAWGIGVALHAVQVFGSDTYFGEGWEERKARELFERDQTGPRHA